MTSEGTLYGLVTPIEKICGKLWNTFGSMLVSSLTVKIILHTHNN